MEYRWHRRNLKDVVAKTEQFLEDQGFIFSKDESENCVKLSGVRRREKYDAKLVEIVISQSPEELSVRFEGGNHLKPIAQLSPLFSLWGGGSLVLKEIKAAEQYRKIEDEFWKEIEKIVSSE